MEKMLKWTYSKKLERARDTGRGLLMITDDRDNEDEEGDASDGDSDYKEEDDCD